VGVTTTEQITQRIDPAIFSQPTPGLIESFPESKATKCFSVLWESYTSIFSIALGSLTLGSMINLYKNLVENFLFFSSFQ
jgi:hypothetical protein